MSKSALGKLAEADDLNKTATKIMKRDPESARQLNDLARMKRKSAIKQLRRRPKKKKTPRVLG